MQVQITKWGNSLGLRIPKDLARRIGLSEGSTVEIEEMDNRLIVTPATSRYSLAELLRDTRPEAYHQSAVDWGPDVGREIVDCEAGDRDRAGTGKGT